MTATAKAAGNGSAKTTELKPCPACNGSGSDLEKRVPVQREHGLDRLREDECYHLTELVERSLSESEYLVRKVHNKAFNRTLDYDGSKGTVPLDRDEATRILNEARDCTQVAMEYLYRAVSAMKGEPPF